MAELPASQPAQATTVRTGNKAALRRSSKYQRWAAQREDQHQAIGYGPAAQQPCKAQIGGLQATAAQIKFLPFIGHASTQDTRSIKARRIHNSARCGFFSPA